MSIRIIRQGLLATICDGGRRGYRCLGIGPGGALDGLAFQVANFLCGNEGHEPVMELHFPAPEMVFEKDTWVSVAGADFGALLNEEKIPSWSRFFAAKGMVLRFANPILGARAYLAVCGGWQSDKWLGSAGTHLKLGVGGFRGRALEKDDQVDFPERDSPAFQIRTAFSLDYPEYLGMYYEAAEVIRCIRGPEYEELLSKSKMDLEEQTFTITARSDRMGLHLDGNELRTISRSEMISSAVDFGTIQLLPDGHCVVLMADHQTTGGYSRIASVIKADLPKLAQARPGEAIRFKILSLSEAEASLLEMEKRLVLIRSICRQPNS